MIRIDNSKTVLRWFLLTTCVLFFFASCRKNLDKYYEVPSWLKGNAWQTLEEDGNYTIFLDGIERSGFKDLVNGTGIVTVIAPNDSAFRIYLSGKGYESIGAVPDADLKKLIAYHLVYYSFDKEKFFNFQPYPVGTEIDPSENGLYYKHRTKSRSEIETFFDPTENNVSHKVFHKERFLPVFSAEIFKSKNIDAKTNYEFFYPNSAWTGGSDGFNISNASVKQYAIVTDNGYIYEVNKVLEPLETIYKELDDDSNYSIFKKAYDRFAEFNYDEQLTSDYGNGDSLFLYYHTALPKIASEWTYNGENGIPDYANMAELSKKAYNVFAPDNKAMTDFYNTYWKQYYTSMDSVNFWPIAYLLYNHVFEGSIVFPEEIEAGKIKSAFGNSIQFDRASAEKKQICVNGTLYGLNEVLTPPMFNSVTGPALEDPRFNMFLIMIAQTYLIYPLMSDQKTFKLFLPTDSMLLNEHTFVRGRELFYVDLNPKKFGQQIVQIMGDVDFVPMNTYQMSEVVQNHVAVGAPFATSGFVSVYKTMSSYNYLMVSHDSIFSSSIYNSKSPGTKFKLIAGERNNGDTYELQGDASALTLDNTLFKTIMNPASLLHPAEFNEFKTKLITKTDFISTNFSFLQGNRFIVFIPDNSHSADFDLIPTASATDYAKYYFVDVSNSNLADYPFAGAGVQGKLKTFKSNTNGGFEELTLVDTGNGLEVYDKLGNKAKVIGFFPHIYADGAAYLIDNMLKFE